MRLFVVFLMMFFLSACDNPTIQETDFSAYFKNVDGTAVFYNPVAKEYKIHNLALSRKRSSPCSTFKIMSSYIFLSEQKEDINIPILHWNKTQYRYSTWNKDMDLQEAFRTSCVWYFRSVINQLKPETMKRYLRKYQYGNQDISDWTGSKNTNTNLSELKGFWIESSLQVSPLEQVMVLERIFEEKSKATQILKEMMLVTTEPFKVYGKTGMGIKNDFVNNAWFVGFFEKEKQVIYFVVRLNDRSNSLKDYRHLASQYAKQIALDIITSEASL